MSEQQQDGVGKALRDHFAQDAARLPADTVDKVMGKVQREQARSSRTKWVMLSVALAACVGLVVGFGPKQGWQQQSRANEGPQPASSAPASELGLQEESSDMPGGWDHRQGRSEWEEDSLLRLTALNSLVGDEDDEAVDDDGDDDDDEAATSPSDIHAEGTWESEAQ